jgi:hypothetical protein
LSRICLSWRVFSNTDPAPIEKLTHFLHRFEDQQLTSFSSLVIFQKLFEVLCFKEKLRQCFRHLKVTPIFGHSSIVLLLVVHFILGYRE